MKKVIISGGGTGGHIFPALAIANEIRTQFPACEILFVGAEGKMEMEKVPAAGFDIVGLPIVGFQRKQLWKNFSLPFKLLKSLLKARKIVKNFQPQVVVGVGGYASGPTLKMAQHLGIPTIIQEQNSFPGKTNRLLAKKVKAVCVAYEGLEKVFTNTKIVLTGNPVRAEIVNANISKEEAFECFPSLDPTKKTILVIGGSLGARTLNQSVLNSLSLLKENDLQVIWQCGKYYFEEMKQQLQENNSVILCDFIAQMDAAYSLADIVVSRAGALSISELCIAGKTSIFVPSPNVSEDHQTKNAQALVNKNAAILVKDDVAINDLFPMVVSLINDAEKSTSLAKEMKHLGKPNATKEIVEVIKSVAL